MELIALQLLHSTSLQAFTWIAMFSENLEFSVALHARKETIVVSPLFNRCDLRDESSLCLCASNKAFNNCCNILQWLIVNSSIDSRVHWTYTAARNKSRTESYHTKQAYTNVAENENFIAS